MTFTDLRPHPPVLPDNAFTLIELSIVLVIIGLIVGGVLVGQDMIRAAAERAQVTQIEKYNTAVNTFKGKYGYLPGDIPTAPATQFGFTARGANPAEGDGNGIIYGSSASPLIYSNSIQGESMVFWVDLSQAQLIEGGFNTARSYTWTGYNIGATTTPNLNNYLPPAKIGNSSYIYVYGMQSVNYFGLSAVVGLGLAPLSSSVSLTVRQAYDIDQKVDDGLPQSGNVTAVYADYGVFGTSFPNDVGWSGSGGITGNTAYTTAASGSATTCYDNSNTPGGSPGVAGATQHYSVEISNGNNVNCGLSFRFQ